MRRKTLIVVALVAIMLLSSFLPIIGYAADDVENTIAELTFNTPLYKGLKAYFQEEGIEAKYDDIDHTIIISQDVIAGIEELSLKEKGINDISGIEAFTNVKSLIISANQLTENSNLEVLNNFANLEYLDLSSNNITDVSAIEGLVTTLLEKDSNAVNLSSQTATMVVDVETDAKEELLTVTYTLPQILQMAGIVKKGEITNKGYLKADWFVNESKKSNASFAAPYIVGASVPNPVTAEENTFKIQVGVESGGSYTSLQGLIKLSIKIEDRNNGSYNPNPSSENILKDSIFTLYYVVHTDVTDGVIIKDNRLYTAIKEQLIKNQEINTDLLSYRYGTTSGGELAYDLCDYRTESGKTILSINGNDLYELSDFTGSRGSGYIYDLRTNEDYLVDYDVITDEIIDEDGNVTYKRRVKVPHINAECRNLYVDAWDEAQAFVITDLDIVNKITSLILNDKQIRNLSGIENFVGLESNLNVSFNYINSLAYIYALDANKQAKNNSLKELFNEKKAAMASTKTKITTAYNKILSTKKSIEDNVKKIKEQIDIIATITDTTSSEYTNAIKAIQSALKAIYGDPENDEDNGLMGEFEKSLSDPQDGLNSNLSTLYSRLANMYRVFNKEYKLASILVPTLNYQTEEEYLEYKDKSSTKAGAKEITKEQAARIANYEKAGALSDFEKELIVKAFGLFLSDEQEYPVSYALNELVKMLEEDDASRSTWVNMNETFIEIGLYSGAANYCLLERMNKDAGATACFTADYLEKLVENYQYEGIDSELAEAIFHKLKDNEASTRYNSTLNNLFLKYIEEKLVYNDSDFFKCEGGYYQVRQLKVKETKATSPAGDYPTEVYFTETMQGGKESSKGIFFFTQLMSLANKFTVVDETDKYIALPALKKIDIRNNEIESLGPTKMVITAPDGTVTTKDVALTDLAHLKELYVGHNFVTGDIKCVDWAAMTSLKKLDLSYNFIDDISPLQVLENLRYLDVSDNLLEGSFNLSLRKMPKLKDLILAGNRYSDITRIINDFEITSGGDPTRYFAREDTLNLDLSRQELEINLEDPIEFKSGVRVYELELPPIFAQLEYIDATRTAFGTTSSKGSIKASGGVAYIPVYEEGDFTAEVTVIAKNGYPEDITTSMGINSRCKINYSVRRMGVLGIKIVEEEVTTVARGSTQKFTAKVEGNNVEDTRVIWKVEGNTSTGTGISDTGLLVVGANETAETLTIKATSAIDARKEAVKVVAVVDPELEKVVTSVTVTATSGEVEPGKAISLSATVEGSNLKDSDQAVTWTVAGNTSVNTKISNQGVLSVGDNETSGALLVTATSVTDPNRSGSLAITVKLPEGQEPDNPNPPTPPDPDNPDNPDKPDKPDKPNPPDPSGIKYGYTVSEDGTELLGISPDTITTAFITKLLTEQGYTAEVKRNGNKISDTAKVATSDLVVISKDGKVVDTFELIVKGDVNGDGVADAEDSSLIKAYRAKLTTLSGAFLTAADIDADGEITVVDVRLLLYHRAKIDGYIL